MRLRTLFAAVALALCLPTAAAAQNEAYDDGRISVIVEGEGPDVVLIPGLASSRDVWRGLADRLKDRYRLHLVQLAGFAGAPPSAGAGEAVVAPAAEAVAAYLEAARLDRPALIAHSLGGAMALMIGARHPDLPGKLLVVDSLPFYALTFSSAATVEAVRGQAAQLREATIAASDTQYTAMQQASIGRMTKTEAARPALAEAGLASDRRTVANAIYELMTTDLRPELERIAAPTTVAYAYDATYGVPAERIDALFGGAYAGLPGARLTRVDDSYHFIMLDQQERFYELVDAVLRSTEPRR